MSSYQESVIIPLELYRTLTNEKNVELKADLPSSVNVKLYQQEHLGKVHRVPDPLVKLGETEALPDAIIIDSVKTVDKPTVKSILDKIQQFKNIVSWNKNLEIILNGNVIPDTNIVKIMQYLMKSRVVTSERDIPRGASQFYEALIEQLEIPKSWIKQKPRLRMNFPWQPYN